MVLKAPWETKRKLREKLNEMDREKKEKDKQIAKLENNLHQLKIKYNKEKEEKEFYIEQAGYKKGTSIETELDRDWSTLRRYLYETRNFKGAEKLLDAMSQLLKIKGKGSFFVTVSRKNKVDYAPAYPDEKQRAGLLQICKIMRYSPKKYAQVPYQVFETLKTEAEQDNFKINLVETLLVGKYLVTDRIFYEDMNFSSSVDLSDLYRKLLEKPATHTRTLTIKGMINKMLMLNAYTITRQYDIDKNLIKAPSHREKARQILQAAKKLEKIDLTKKQEEILAEWFLDLDGEKMYSVRDGTGFNHIPKGEIEKTFLSQDYLEKKQPPKKIEELIDKAVYPYDFDDAFMMSFPFDEYLRAVDFLMPALPFKQAKEFEDPFLDMITGFGGIVKNKEIQSVRGGVFRNTRMGVVCATDKNYVNHGRINTNHCLEMAARRLLQRDLSPKEKQGLCFNDIFHLVVESYS